MAITNYVSQEYIFKAMELHSAIYWSIQPIEGAKYIAKQERDIPVEDSIELLREALDSITGTVKVTITYREQKERGEGKDNYTGIYTYHVKKLSQNPRAAGAGAAASGFGGGGVPLELYLSAQNEIQSLRFELFQEKLSQNTGSSTLDRVLDKVLENPSLVSGIGRMFGAPASGGVAAPAKFEGNEQESINQSIEELKKLDSDLVNTLRNLVVVCKAYPDTLEAFKAQLTNYINAEK